LISGYKGEQKDLDQYIQQKIADLGYAASNADILLKAHAPGEQSLALLRAGIAKNIFTYRDPRDSLCSFLNFEKNKDFDYVLNTIGGNWEQGDWYQKNTDTLFICYEDMMVDAQKEIRRIAAYLDLVFPDEVYQSITEQTSLQASKKIIAEIANESESEILHGSNSTIDKTTLLHDNHISTAQGKTGRWQEEFSTSQQLQANLVLSPLLVDWGYETEDSLEILLRTLMVPADWQNLGQQMIHRGMYSLAARLYELGVEMETEDTSNYWYLGLALFLMEQTDAAQLAWFTGLSQLTDTESDRAIADLAQILHTEIANQTAQGNLKAASHLKVALVELTT
jgi:hypothetical protein